MDFIGLPVRIVTQSGLCVEGVVGDVQTGSQTLQLVNVKAISPDGTVSEVPSLAIPGPQIQDLQILSEKKLEPVVSPSDGGSSRGGRRPASPPTPNHAAPSPPPDPMAGFNDPAIISFSKPPSKAPSPAPSKSSKKSGGGAPAGPARQFTVPTSAARSDRSKPFPSVDTHESDTSETEYLQSSAALQPSKPVVGRGVKSSARQRETARDTWQTGEVSDYHETDFDIQGNLDRFDKKRVFEEIKLTDDVDPGERLVAINRTKPALAKLAPTENVLDSSPSPSRSMGDSSASGQQPRTSKGKARRKSSLLRGSSSAEFGCRHRTVFGVSLPSATALQMIEAERVATVEAGLSDVMLVENAGRSISAMILQALGGNRRFSGTNHNAPPHVVILCGANMNGAFGACAGRHLANRGTQVSILFAADDQEGVYAGNPVAMQLKCLQAMGVKVHSDVLELPSNPVDMAVDAILGMYSLREISSEEDRELACEVIAWTASVPAPILSIDIPSGIDASTGLVAFPPYAVQPKWTIAVGIPKVGLVDRSVTGELFLADAGIPHFVWSRVGIKNWPVGCGPWEDRFHIGLEYC